MWQFKTRKYHPSTQKVDESLYTVGNGYLGVRGAFEEGYPGGTSIRGTYINGLYDRVPMVHAEMAYGFPTVQDKQPRIIDTQTCEIWLDGERAQLKEGHYTNYQRLIDYKRGISLRSYTFKTVSGKSAKLSFTRMASFENKNVLIYTIDVQYKGNIEMVSVLDANIENYTNPNDPRTGQGHSKLMRLLQINTHDQYAYAEMTTRTTGIHQATAVRHDYKAEHFYHRMVDDSIHTVISGKDALHLEKIVVLTDSLRFENPLETAKEICKNVNTQQLFEAQESFLKKFWETSGIDIEGAPEEAGAIRFMQYQLLQSVGGDLYSNVSAKGLSGEGYEGHYFWDTEIYVLPVLLIHDPERAKALLEYRHHILPSALDRALELGHSKGAAYAWRTISGIECSGYFPAGTAQYHINADIAYAFILYHLYTDDWAFMAETGAEVIFQTARIWLEMGHSYEGSFRIHDVTGPDEYSAIVNNNYYTNAMAKYHLTWAHKLYHALLAHQDESIREAFKGFIEKISLDASEVIAMKEAADTMYFPFDEKLQLYAQDDAFLTKPIWPFASVNASQKPLLLHFHPLTIYRHQVLKQADTVLAHYMLEEFADFTHIKNAFKYYERLTTHDSSLSGCIYGIMAARCGETEKAYHYFKESILLDLEDTHGNTKDGLHMANISGSVLSVIAGFGGFRIKEEGIHLRPTKPKAWIGYAFKIKYKARLISVKVDTDIHVALLSGPSITIQVWGKPMHLKLKEVHIVEIPV